jgi:uncharacterized membrane protein
VFCWSDTAHGGAACGSDPSAWSGAGGTSFASPIMAGIQALINQKAGGPQGNPAPIYYQLAASEFGSTGSASCNASNGAGVSSSCTFYDVTDGDIDVDCTGPNCYLGGASVGVLSTSNGAFSPAYGTSVGWDFATGIGSVNAANLVNNWPATAPAENFSLSASPGTVTVVQGASVSTTITITPLNGFNGNVTLAASGLPAGVTASFNPSSATSGSTLTFAASAVAATGSVTVTVTGSSGNLANQTKVALIVNPAGNYTLSASPTALSIAQGSQGTSSITITSSNGFAGAVNLSASGLPSGVTASFNPVSTTGTSALTLTAGTSAATGTFTITINGVSGNLNRSTTISLTVTPAPNFSLSVSPTTLSIARRSSGTTTITITPANGFSSAVTLSASGMRNGTTASVSPNPATGSSTLTLSASRKATTGTVTITITGKSGNLTYQTTISLTVHR